MAVQRCGPSGMFLLSACCGMFDFGMFNYFHLSVCCIPHAHTRTLPARCWSCSWSRGRDWLRPRFNAFDPQEPACWSCGCFLGKVLRWMLLPTAIECCHECFFYRVFRRRLHRRNMHGGILSPFTGNGRVAKVCAMRYV